MVDRETGCVGGFGTGKVESMRRRDIDVQKKPGGEPFLMLTSGAEQLAKARNVSKTLITQSDTNDHAMSVVVFES